MYLLKKENNNNWNFSISQIVLVKVEIYHYN